MLIFFYLSAQIYDPLISANPNDFLLNFFPHGQSEVGTVYQPLANVFLYFFYSSAEVNKSITSSEKILKEKGFFPLFNISCIKVIMSLRVENRPEFPAI
jgi:hypothetical protein